MFAHIIVYLSPMRRTNFFMKVWSLLCLGCIIIVCNRKVMNASACEGHTHFDTFSICRDNYCLVKEKCHKSWTSDLLWPASFVYYRLVLRWTQAVPTCTARIMTILHDESLILILHTLKRPRKEVVFQARPHRFLATATFFIKWVW